MSKSKKRRGAKVWKRKAMTQGWRPHGAAPKRAREIVKNPGEHNKGMVAWAVRLLASFK